MSKIDSTPRIHVKGAKPDGAIRPCGAELGCWIVQVAR